MGEEATEDRDEYSAENIFWVLPEARWVHLKAKARQEAAAGRLVDDAMANSVSRRGMRRYEALWP